MVGPARLARKSALEVRKRPMDAVALGAMSLKGTDGATHRLGDLWRERPVVLVFLRHFG